MWFIYRVVAGKEQISALYKAFTSLMRVAVVRAFRCFWFKWLLVAEGFRKVDLETRLEVRR